LKFENILTVSNPNEKTKFSIKITDFGLSTLVSMDTLHNEHKKRTNSLSTMNPKQQKQHHILTKKLAHVTDTSLVYSNKQLNILHQRWGTEAYFAPEIYERAYGYQADIWSLGCVLYEMLTGELAFPYRERKVSMIHRWLWHGGRKPPRLFAMKYNYGLLSDTAKSLLKGMLHPNPMKRFHIDECLAHPFFNSVTNNNYSDGSQQILSNAYQLIQSKVIRTNLRLEETKREIASKRLKLLKTLSQGRMIFLTSPSTFNLGKSEVTEQSLSFQSFASVME